MGYDPILSGLILCGLYAKPFAWGFLFFKAFGYLKNGLNRVC